MSPALKPALKIASAAAAYTAAAAVLLLNAPLVGRLLVPLFDGFIPLVYSRFDFHSVKLIKRKTEWYFFLQVNNSQAIPFGKTQLIANAGPSSQTLLAHSVQHILFLGLVLLCGALYRRCNPWRLVGAGLLLLLLVELLDVPFVLSGAIEDLLVAYLGNDGWASTLRIEWMGFLNNGGRIALALVCGWIALIFAAVDDTRRPPAPARQ